MINAPKIYKMRVVFRFVANGPERPNVFNAVRKMVLASGLPFEPAKVNANWPRLSYGPALAYGQEAEREYLDIYLQQSVSAELARQELQAAAPKAVTLLSVERVPYALASVQNLAAAARYRVEGDFTAYQPAQTLEEFLNAAHIHLVRRADNGLTCTTDAKAYVAEGKTVSPSKASLTLLGVDGKWIKPEAVFAAWLGIDIPAQDEAFTVDGLKFIREGLFWKDSQGEFHLI